jgi:hypothetical protein
MNKKDKELLCDYYIRINEHLIKLDCSTNPYGVYANEKINNRVNIIRDILYDLIDDFECEETYFKIQEENEIHFDY